MSHDPNAVTDHYGRTDLTESILNALRAADIDVEHLSLDDLAPVEEFHIGGREATTELAQLAKIDRSDRVLDIGCGIGGPARALAAMYGCRVTGVDLTEPFCEAATELNRRTGLSDLIEIHHGSALDLPLADASIDVVWMQHVSMNIEDKAGLYCEARRVLVPEGRVAIYEVMVLSEEIKDFVLNGASTAELKREAIRGGMVTLRRSALNKLLEGTTTLSEVHRVSSADNF